jgi:hypothetical protein
VILLIGGPLEALAIAAFALAGMVAWLRRRRYRGPRLVGDDTTIDHSTLAAAEREAREAPWDAALRAPGAPSAGSPPLSSRSRSAHRSDRGRSGN